MCGRDIHLSGSMNKLRGPKQVIWMFQEKAGWNSLPWVLVPFLQHIQVPTLYLYYVIVLLLFK